MHKDTQTRPATLTYIRLDGYRKKDRRFEEERDGDKKKEKLDGDGKRGQKEGGEGQMEGRGGERPRTRQGGKESEERFVFD